MNWKKLPCLWQEWKKKKPNKDKLIKVLDVPGIENEVAEEMLKQALGPQSLRSIIDTVIEDVIDEKAGLLLLQNFPTCDNICFVLDNVRTEKAKQEALKLLKKLYPESAEEKAGRRQEGLRKAVFNKIIETEREK